jgi:hypothetical protein
VKKLNDRDLRILKKGFMESLNKTENKDKCIEKSVIFEDTGLRAYSAKVIPYVVQELQKEGLVEDCNNKDGIRITHKEKQRAKRTDETNAYAILQTLATQAAPGLTGKHLENLLQITPSEINYAAGDLEESGLVQAIGPNRIDPFTFDELVLTPRGKYQIGQLKKISLRNNQGVTN